MPDHIHLFCAPGSVPPPGLKRWVTYWKSRISQQWSIADYDSTGGARSVVPSSECPPEIWQRDFWDTQIRSLAHYDEKLSYVRDNPVRRGLVQVREDWPYQGEIFKIGWI